MDYDADLLWMTAFLLGTLVLPTIVGLIAVLIERD